MLLALVSLMLLTSIVLLAIRRDRRCLLIALTCASLALFIFSILTYIAKKGGIGREISAILYGTRSVRDWFQYLIMTFEELGALTAAGRYSFPLLLLVTALDMAYFDFALRIKKHIWMLFILPLLVSVCYIPAVFKGLIDGREMLLRLLVILSSCYVYSYLAAALAMAAAEYRSITLPFFRRRFIPRSMILLSLAMVYALYAAQDPAQIYMFYRSDYMFLLGLWYLTPGLSQPMYAIVLVGSIVFSVLGFVYLLRYMSINFDSRKEEITLKRNASTASRGISMFIHGTKNELLSMDILLRRIAKRYPDDADIAKLMEINSSLGERLQSLHRSSKSDCSLLTLTALDPVIEKAIRQVRSCYPEAGFEIIRKDAGIAILADGAILSEAIGNLLMNAYEAQRENGQDVPVRLEYGLERLWVSIRISDRGKGIDPRHLRQIYQPFYSSKNSSQNWGMGMYFSKNAIKGHLGSIRYERNEWGGSCFIILLPKLGSPYAGGEA